MKKFILALLSVFTIAACGGGKVQYNLTCAATCTGGELIALEVPVCDESGQDLTMIAQRSVSACVTSAEQQGCPAASCACQAAETTTFCE